MTRRTASPFLNAHAFAACQGQVEFINSPPGGTATTTRYYYDGQNAIAEYDESDDIQRAYMHGTQYMALDISGVQTPALRRFATTEMSRVHERAVMRVYDAAPEDHYYLLEELAAYDTYGDAEIWAWPPGDIANRDGTTGLEDSGLVDSTQAAEDFDPLCDADLDGDVDMDDVVAVVAIVNNPAIRDTVETTYSSLEKPYFFTGRVTDTLHASDLLVENDGDSRRVQLNGERYYDPKHGRWLSRDPLGVRPDPPLAALNVGRQHTDGMDLYEYARSEPTRRTDPTGLWVIALAGANGIGDGAFQNTYRRVALAESIWYEASRPCTVIDKFDDLGVPGEYITNPAEPGLLPLNPQWDKAVQKLTNAVKRYNSCVDDVLRRPKNCGCVCPQYLHIIGYSDGASTIAHWLNKGAPELRSEYLGLVGIVDLVRYAENVPNDERPKWLPVSTYGKDSTNLAFQSTRQGLLEWTGYNLASEEVWENIPVNGANHGQMPGNAAVVAGLGFGVDQSMRQLINKCACSKSSQSSSGN